MPLADSAAEAAAPRRASNFHDAAPVQATEEAAATSATKVPLHLLRDGAPSARADAPEPAPPSRPCFAMQRTGRCTQGTRAVTRTTRPCCAAGTRGRGRPVDLRRDAEPRRHAERSARTVRPRAVRRARGTRRGAPHPRDDGARFEREAPGRFCGRAGSRRRRPDSRRPLARPAAGCLPASARPAAAAAGTPRRHGGRRGRSASGLRRTLAGRGPEGSRPRTVAAPARAAAAAPPPSAARTRLPPRTAPRHTPGPGAPRGGRPWRNRSSATHRRTRRRGKGIRDGRRRPPPGAPRAFAGPGRPADNARAAEAAARASGFAAHVAGSRWGSRSPAPQPAAPPSASPPPTARAPPRRAESSRRATRPPRSRPAGPPGRGLERRRRADDPSGRASRARRHRRRGPMATTTSP